MDGKKEDSDILNLQLTTREQGGVLCDFHGDPVDYWMGPHLGFER